MNPEPETLNPKLEILNPKRRHGAWIDIGRSNKTV
jgi:hypothetical protein